MRIVVVAIPFTLLALVAVVVALIALACAFTLCGLVVAMSGLLGPEHRSIFGAVLATLGRAR